MFYETAPLDIIDYPADDNHKSNDRLGYRFIFLHYTAGTKSEDWLSRTSAPKRVSVHRLIKRDGRIYKIVPDNEVAFTQGGGKMGGFTTNLNRWGLSIELEHLDEIDYPRAQLLSCARQVVEWRGLYGDLPLLYHRDVDRAKSNCPKDVPRAELDRLIFALIRTTSAR